LTIDESKKFFALLMDLNYAKKDDRQAYKNIMKYVDPESMQKALKD
jgi:hypothetical protein